MTNDRCPSCMRELNGPVCDCGWPEKGHNASHQLPVGTVLRGRYQIGRCLGQGGFGITYLAWDKLMQQCVAVKEFYPGGTVFRKSATSLAVDCGTEEIIPHYEYSKERFLREASALVKFKDIPEVVDILDFAEENNTAYIVMEYVRGMDLAKYIRMKGGKLAPEETFRILRPVMEALAKVHKGGIVHRDISPDNIILDPMGGAKLLDFGAVRAVEDPAVDKGLNKSTEAILKQGFAPIEQYNTRGSLGPWTDEYAVCATVWYCLTGTVPTEPSIRVSEGIDPDWSTVPGLPEHQQKALAKGLSCRAKDRYRSLDELLEALFPEEKSAVLPVEHPKTAAQEMHPAKAEKRPAGSKKNPLIWIAAAVALLILIAASILLSRKKEAPSSAHLQETPGETSVQTEPKAPETVPTLPETVPTTLPMTEEEKSYLQAEELLAQGKLGEAAIAFGKLASYADARERSFEIWDQIAFRDTISAGVDHTVGLKSDGTVVALGNTSFSRCDVSGWSNIVAVSAGGTHTVGLRADGTVVAVGATGDGQHDMDGWSDIVAVCAGHQYTIGLRADGTVVAVGINEDGQCNVADWTDIVAISAGRYHTVGLRADGTVLAVGNNSNGICNVENWSDIVAVSAGGNHTVGLRADGSVVATGVNGTDEYYKGGQCDVADWSNVVAISTGWGHTVGLRSDSTVLAVGFNMHGQCDATSWGNIVAISAGEHHTVGLLRNGHVIAEGFNSYGQCYLNDWMDIRIPQRANWYAPDDIPTETASPEDEANTARAAYANAEQLLAEGKLGEAAIAFGKLAGYADARERSFAIWDKITVRETVSGGNYFTVGLKTDGTVLLAGRDDFPEAYTDWTDIVAVSAGMSHFMGLRADGTVVAIGDNEFEQQSDRGELDVESWTDIVAIAAGVYHTVGLKADGTVVAVGDRGEGMATGPCDVEDWTDIVAVSAGIFHTVGLKVDGTVVYAGKQNYGQDAVTGWTDIVAISTSGDHTLGLKNDGTVVATGNNSEGQCYNTTVWKDIVAISAGDEHSVGLKADGTAEAVGWYGKFHQCSVGDWQDIVAISAGSFHTIGLRTDGTVIAVGGQNWTGKGDVSGWTDIRIYERPIPFR